MKPQPEDTTSRFQHPPARSVAHPQAAALLSLPRKAAGSSKVDNLANAGDAERAPDIQRKSSPNPLWAIAAAMAVFFGLMAMFLTL